MLLGTSYDDGEKTSEEKCYKSFITGRYHFCVENLPDEMMSRRRAVMNIIMHLISEVE